MQRTVQKIIISLLILTTAAHPQQTEPARHQRVQQDEIPGRRIELQTLRGSRLFLNRKLNAKKRLPLVVHFHGAPWLVETHVSKELPGAALVTVQLGAGSSAYGRPFSEEGTFTKLIDEARSAAGTDVEWSSITLTGFSAGYGAIRAILRDDQNYRRVSGVLLLDGIHAGNETGPVGNRQIISGDLDVFVRFARDAAAGRKNFVITHSQIVPGTYAGTTECSDHILDKLKVSRKPSVKAGPMGMRQLSYAGRGRLRVFGYAGDTAPDHVDFLHAMPAWFRYLDIE